MSYAHGTLPGLKDMFAEIERSRVMRDLLKDKAICEAASAGPWKAHGQINRNMAVISDRGNILEVVSSESKEEDAQFIAAAHEGWPHAIDRAIAAEKENAELRQRIAWYKRSIEMILQGSPVDSFAATVAESLIHVDQVSNQGEETKG